MSKNQSELTYEQLIERIEDREIWDEFLIRYHGQLENFRHWYERNRIQGGALTFDDILQELVAPSPKRPISYLQKALIDKRPPTETDFLRFAKLKFRQRLIDEARREAKHQLAIAVEFAGELPQDQPRGLASMEIWQVVRNAVGKLDEVDRMITKLYYGFGSEQSGESAKTSLDIKDIVSELNTAKDLGLNYGQVQEKLKRIRRLLKKELQNKGIEIADQEIDKKLNKSKRLLGIVLLPFEESIKD